MVAQVDKGLAMQPMEAPAAQGISNVTGEKAQSVNFPISAEFPSRVLAS